MPYPEGLIIFGLPVVFLAFGVECAILKLMCRGGGEQSLKNERRVKTLTRGATLAILIVIYLLMKK
jgi:hypothetical protein